MSASGTSEKRKIGILCEIWRSGGIESFVYNSLVRMDLDALEVEIVVSELGESIFTEPLKKLGIRFTELSGRSNRPENYRLFRKHMREHHYDVIHINAFHGMSFYYARLAKQAGVKRRIVHSHNAGLRPSPTRMLKLLLHRVYAERFAGDATDLWACSRLAAEFLFPHPIVEKRAYQFVPNAIDAETFRFSASARERMRQELRVGDRLVLGCVGRICSQKNQIFLLDVLSILRDRGADCELLLVGDGSDLPAVREKAGRLGLSDRVLLPGVSSQVPDYLSVMDLYLFPSCFEGLPISVIEAQASGLPVLYHEELAEEAAIMPAFVRLPLEASAWADAVLQMRPAQNREAAADGIKNTMFDISSLTRWLEEEYRG